MSITSTDTKASPAYEAILEIVKKNQELVISLIGEGGQEDSEIFDTTLSEDDISTINTNLEALKEEVFSTAPENFELPVINQVKEDFYDTAASYSRLAEVSSLTRDWYYANAFEVEYPNIINRQEYLKNINMVYIEKHVEAFRLEIDEL